MLGYVLIGFLAAFGAFCVLWSLLGSWLTDSREERIFLLPAPGREEATLRRYRWLRHTGFVKGRLIVVSNVAATLSEKYPDMRFVTWEEFTLAREFEQERWNGT